MTREDQEAERVKGLAEACFRQMTIASEAHSYVDRIHRKWGDHPAFRTYMIEMNLSTGWENFSLADHSRRRTHHDPPADHR